MSRRRTSGNSASVSVADRLRELLAASELLELTTVCDPLGARLAADSGFAAVNLPGYAIGAHLPGDTCLTLAHLESGIGRVARACGLPILLDADVDWTDEAGLDVAIRRCSAAGAAGIQLSSQHLPEAVPFDSHAEAARSHAQLVHRVRVAAATGVVVAARCEFETDDRLAIARAVELAEAGAEALLVHGPDAVLAPLAEELPGVRLIYAAAPALPCRPSIHPVARLQEWGFAGIVNKYHSCHCRPLAALSGAEQPHTAHQR